MRSTAWNAEAIGTVGAEQARRTVAIKMNAEPSRGRPNSAPPALQTQVAAIFVDVDGTLAPFEPDPAAVCATPRRTSLLIALSQALGGRIAAVSGRSISEIDRILGAAVIAAAGLHGLERRDANGRCRGIAPHPAISVVVDRFRDRARQTSGLVMEAKGASAALHYRMRPELGTELIAEAEALGRSTGLEFRPGAMVVALRTPGPHKGDAVRAFMDEPPFRGARPSYVGDDLTDEDGFKAALSFGGFGGLVGPDRPTRATHGLADVEAVLTWLETSLPSGAARRVRLGTACRPNAETPPPTVGVHG